MVGRLLAVEGVRLVGVQLGARRRRVVAGGDPLDELRGVADVLEPFRTVLGGREEAVDLGPGTLETDARGVGGDLRGPSEKVRARPRVAGPCEGAVERIRACGHGDEDRPPERPDVLDALRGDAADGQARLRLQARRVGDVVDPQLLGDLGRHLRRIAVDRLHPGDDRIIAASTEQLALDPADRARQRVGGCPGVRSGEGGVGQQDRLAGHPGEALHQDVARHGRAHAQEDRPGLGVTPRESVGERERVKVERIEDVVEQRPPERPLLAVPGILGDVRDVGYLFDEDDAVHGSAGDAPLCYPGRPERQARHTASKAARTAISRAARERAWCANSPGRFSIWITICGACLFSHLTRRCARSRNAARCVESPAVPILRAVPPRPTARSERPEGTGRSPGAGRTSEHAVAAFPTGDTLTRLPSPGFASQQEETAARALRHAAAVGASHVWCVWASSEP